EPRGLRPGEPRGSQEGEENGHETAKGEHVDPRQEDSGKTGKGRTGLVSRAGVPVTARPARRELNARASRRGAARRRPRSSRHRELARRAPRSLLEAAPSG